MRQIISYQHLMTPSQNPHNDPQKDMLIKSQFTPSLKNVLYSETQRSKRIATAMYMITEHIDEEETLKRHIRQYATELLKASHVPYNAQKEEIEFRVSFMMSSIESLMSFIEVSSAAFLISQDHARLLLRELRSLFIHLTHRYEGISNQQTPLDKSSSIDIESIISPKQTSENTHHKHQANQQVSRSISQNQPATPKTLQPFSSREERKENILAVIRKTGAVTIKDIATHITGCSEKTLQRDLKDLIDSGVVKKDGDRRWSTYSTNE